MNMLSRREFIVGSAAALVLPGLVKPVVATPTKQKPYVDWVVVDGRFSAWQARQHHADSLTTTKYADSLHYYSSHDSLITDHATAKHWLWSRMPLCETVRCHADSFLKPSNLIVYVTDSSGVVETYDWDKSLLDRFTIVVANFDHPVVQYYIHWRDKNGDSVCHLDCPAKVSDFLWGLGF